MKIVDSNIWISFFNKDDINNSRATKILSELLNEKICLTDYIIIEVTTVLLQKASKHIADNFIEFVQNSVNINIIYSSQILFDKYLDFFKDNNFLKLSFVDQSLVFLSKDFNVITFDKELIKYLDSK